MDAVLRAYERAAVEKLEVERQQAIRAVRQLLLKAELVAWEEIDDRGEDRAEVDLGALADHWLALVHPVWQAYLKRGGGPRLLRLRDIRSELKRHPLATEQLRALVTKARWVRPVDERVVAAIVGVAA